MLKDRNQNLNSNSRIILLKYIIILTFSKKMH